MSRIVGFVKNGEEVVQTIYPATADDVRTEEGGALRVTDHDGEVFIFAAGTWTKVNLRLPENA